MTLDWTKLYEVITKPLSFASSLFLFVVSSLILFGPAHSVERLGLSPILGPYRWTVGLVFLIAVGWLVVSGLFFLGRQVFQLWKHRQRHLRLHRLTTDEKSLLRRYVQHASRSIQVAEGEFGLAQGLTDDGILYRPQTPATSATGFVPYNIVDWALVYLTKHPQLVAETASGAQH